MKPLYIYSRVSSEKQLLGDGLNRQSISKELLKVIEQKHECKFTELLSDRGVSAFKGDNILSTGELGQFIERVNSGYIKNPILLVESIDRITRLPIDNARELFSKILNSGIEIIILKMGYERLITKNSSQDFGLDIQLQIFLHLAYQESKQKSQRIKETFQNNLINKKIKCSRHLPFWIENVKGEYKLIDDEVSKLKECYELRMKGYSVLSIVRHFNDNGIKFRNSRTSLLSATRISNLLKSRTVIGEYPIYDNTNNKKTLVRWEKEFYPPAIEKDLFLKVNATFNTVSNTRQTELKNAFHGLTYCASCGGKMAAYHSKQRKDYYLRCVNKTQNRSSKFIVNRNTTYKSIINPLTDNRLLLKAYYVTVANNLKSSMMCGNGAIKYKSIIEPVLFNFFSYLDVSSIQSTTDNEKNNTNKLDSLNEQLSKLEKRKTRLRKLFLIEDDTTQTEQELRLIVNKINGLKLKVESMLAVNEPLNDSVLAMKQCLTDYAINASQDDLIKINGLFKKLVDRIELLKDGKTGCKSKIHFKTGQVLELYLPSMVHNKTRYESLITLFKANNNIVLP